MDASFCANCGNQIEAADNYCRQCGAAARAGLPTVRQSSVPALWRPQLSPVVRGAAVMAVGTVGQYLLRRAVRGVVGGRPAKTGTIQISQPKQKDGLADEAQIITETVMMRRVRIRRAPQQ